MNEKATGKIEEHFGKIKDPRIGNATRPKLLDILVIAILAVICGADGWSDVALFGKSKQKWLRTFLELPHGILSHDTFGRVFALLDPQEFEHSFMNWVKTIQAITAGEMIAIDGKQLRGSREPGARREAIDVVSAWASTNQLVLGEVKVDEKSNEITAIPKLLQLLDINGCLVTIDAIGTQTEIAERIVEQGGDYVLAVKENQKQLYEDLRLLFAGDQENGYAQPGYSYTRKVSNSHGRMEIRQCWAISSQEYLDYVCGRERWKGLQTVAMIVSQRQVAERVESKTRYYISSRPLDAKAMLKAKREH